MKLKHKETTALLAVSLAGLSLCGVCGEMVEPMGRAYGKVFAQAGGMPEWHYGLVCLAYALAALLAAATSRRLGPRSGLLVGLGLFAGGALSHLPASQIGSPGPFVAGLCVMMCGLSFVETSATPIVMALGDRRRVLHRLFVARTFDVGGWFVGYSLVTLYVERRVFAPAGADPLHGAAAGDPGLLAVATPYVWLGAAGCAMAVAVALMEMRDTRPDAPLRHTGGALLRGVARDRTFVAAAACLFVYTLAQRLCWASIVSHGAAATAESHEDMTAAAARDDARGLLVAGMAAFAAGRVAGALLTGRGRMRPLPTLAAAGAAATLLTLAGALTPSRVGMWLMVVVSGCISVMQPIIFHVGTSHMDSETLRVGVAGLVVASTAGLSVSNSGWGAGDEPGGQMAVAAAAFALITAFALWQTGKNILRPMPPRGPGEAAAARNDSKWKPTRT